MEENIEKKKEFIWLFDQIRKKLIATSRYIITWHNQKKKNSAKT